MKKVKVLVTQPTVCDPIDYNPPGFSVHGILQARILEWVAITFSRESSWPGDQTRVSCIGRQTLHCLSHQGSPIRHRNHHHILPLILVKSPHLDINKHLTWEEGSRCPNVLTAAQLSFWGNQAAEPPGSGRRQSQVDFWTGALPQHVRPMGLSERYPLPMEGWWDLLVFYPTSKPELSSFSQ